MLWYNIDMEDKSFFTKVLGVKAPWHISRVELNTTEGRVDIYIEHQPGVRFPCPQCQKSCGIYDHAEERAFRHLNVCQMKTYLHARVPRLRCPDHGVQQIVHGLADPNASTTYELERAVLDLEQECSITSAARLLRLNWRTCWDILERAVARGFARKPNRLPARIGVDEKSFARGHRYETLVYDIDRGVVEHVCDDRDQRALEQYYQRFDQQQRTAVTAVAMDMWDPYIAATKAFIPEAEKKIVFDRFHVTRYVVDAVDKIRKQEHRLLQQNGSEALKGTKYLWLWNYENIPAWRRPEFDALRQKDLQTARGWAIKENLRHLWNYGSIRGMRAFFKRWYQWAIRSRLAPMIKAARTLKAHLDNIVTYAVHRITNALGESLNSKIEKVKRLACGFRNRRHYRTAIYFHCGGLDLYPVRTSVTGQIIAP